MSHDARLVATMNGSTSPMTARVQMLEKVDVELPAKSRIRRRAALRRTGGRPGWPVIHAASPDEILHAVGTRKMLVPDTDIALRTHRIPTGSYEGRSTRRSAGVSHVREMMPVKTMRRRAAVPVMPLACALPSVPESSFAIDDPPPVCQLVAHAYDSDVHSRMKGNSALCSSNGAHIEACVQPKKIYA